VYEYPANAEELYFHKSDNKETEKPEALFVILQHFYFTSSPKCYWFPFWPKQVKCLMYVWVRYFKPFRYVGDANQIVNVKFLG
jgi:hypothetical protein